MAREREELIDLRHLRYFIVLAEELHFARAAERLQMEQSPLSRAIREMERLLGVRLFERNTRSTRITRAGGVLLEYARRAIALIDQAKTSTRSAALGQSNRLRIGMSDCIAYCDATRILARYEAEHPDVAVALYELPVNQQIAAIRDNLLDASISLDGRQREGLEAQPISRSPICAVMNRKHALVYADTIRAIDLNRSRPLILFNAESDLGGGSQIDDFLGGLDKPCIAARVGSLGALLTHVALGRGIGLIGAAQMMGVDRSDIEVRPLSGVTDQMTTYVLHATCGLSEPLQAFIELARQCSRRDATTGAF